MCVYRYPVSQRLAAREPLFVSTWSSEVFLYAIDKLGLHFSQYYLRGYFIATSYAQHSLNKLPSLRQFKNPCYCHLMGIFGSISWLVFGITITCFLFSFSYLFALYSIYYTFLSSSVCCSHLPSALLSQQFSCRVFQRLFLLIRIIFFS